MAGQRSRALHVVELGPTRAGSQRVATLSEFQRATGDDTAEDRPPDAVVEHKVPGHQAITRNEIHQLEEERDENARRYRASDAESYPVDVPQPSAAVGKSDDGREGGARNGANEPESCGESQTLNPCGRRGDDAHEAQDSENRQRKTRP